MKFTPSLVIFGIVLMSSVTEASQGAIDRSIASEPSNNNWIQWYEWMDKSKRDCGAGCIQQSARDSLTQNATFVIWRAMELQEQVTNAKDDNEIKSIVLAEIPEYCSPADFSKSGNPKDCFTRFEGVTVRQLRQIKTAILQSNENIESLRTKASVQVQRSDAAKQAEKAPINPTILTAEEVQKGFENEYAKSSEELEELATLHFEELAANFPKKPSKEDFYIYRKKATADGKLEDRFKDGCRPYRDSAGEKELCYDAVAYKAAVEKYEASYEEALRDYRKYRAGSPNGRTEAVKAYTNEDMRLSDRLKARRVSIDFAVGKTTREALDRSAQIVMRRAQESQVRPVAPGVQSLEFGTQGRRVATDSVQLDEAAPRDKPRELGNRKSTQPDLHVTIGADTIDQKIQLIQR